MNRRSILTGAAALAAIMHLPRPKALEPVAAVPLDPIVYRLDTWKIPRGSGTDVVIFRVKVPLSEIAPGEKFEECPDSDPRVAGTIAILGADGFQQQIPLGVEMTNDELRFFPIGHADIEHNKGGNV